MKMSPRERTIALLTLLVLVVLGADRLVLTPLQRGRDAVAAQSRQTAKELDRATTLFASRKETAAEWRQMLQAGLMYTPAEAESHVLHAVRDWSRSSGLLLASLQPEKATPAGEFSELSFQATGEGGMKSVAGFLWAVETSPLPLRVTEVHIGTRKEGADDLSLQLRISALCLAAGAGAKQAAPAPREEARSHG